MSFFSLISISKTLYRLFCSNLVFSVSFEMYEDHNCVEMASRCSKVANCQKNDNPRNFRVTGYLNHLPPCPHSNDFKCTHSLDALQCCYISICSIEDCQFSTRDNYKEKVQSVLYGNSDLK